MSNTNPVLRPDACDETAGGNGKKFGFKCRHLTPMLGLNKLALTMYVVEPGKRAFPYHAHSVIEELFIITEGSGTLRHEDEEFPIKAGDVISAPLGEAHQIHNTGDTDLHYLAISSKESTDVVVYPDSEKVLAYSNVFPDGIRHITKKGDARDYFEGEDE